MLNLSTRHQWMIGCCLVLLLSATRNTHFASITHLPEASWAVFFLLGVYLSAPLPLVLLLAWAGILDYVAIHWNGVSSFCVSPAYVLLIPAYTCLWMAGRWFAQAYVFQWRGLFKLVGAALVGASLCELLSSGGFYFFSGRFEAPNLAEFGQRLIQYFPHFLQVMAFYLLLATLVHIVFVLASRLSIPQRAGAHDEFRG